MHDIFGLHPLYHLGALTSVIAVALRGQLQLRIVLLASYLFYIVDNLIGTQQTEWSYLFWNILFFAINVYVLALIILDRTTFGLGPEEREVLGTLVSLTPGQFRRLNRFARWHVADDPTLITTEGIVPDALFYIYEGEIEVMKGDRSIIVASGSFIGEIAFLRCTPASASVRLAPGARYVEWPVSLLRQHLARHNGLRIAVNRMLSDDLAMKLARS